MKNHRRENQPSLFFYLRFQNQAIAIARHPLLLTVFRPLPTRTTDEEPPTPPSDEEPPTPPPMKNHRRENQPSLFFYLRFQNQAIAIARHPLLLGIDGYIGETFIASTISYIYIAFVYVGSSYGDSQLVKLNLQPDTKGEVCERYDMQSEMDSRALQDCVNLKGSTGDNKVIISEKKELEEKLAAMSKEASSGITERGAQLTMVSEKQKPVMSLLELRSSIVQSLKWSRL
ncbi:hypothetical protein L2E82_32341 [Cichorium intybus]|uniref:Uncharacterized protein n=1 Tax=Cichorium intybus TaxID=13427 RepID=A0ACB9BGY4_CICIN|nr:hypothetical protein L2E82_32341 [Cichorium intybus]